MRKLLQLGILALLATSAFAVDNCLANLPVVQAPCIAQLSNGFQIRLIRREASGENVRLYVSDSSFTELPASLITGYEPDLTPAPVPEIAKAPTPLTIEQHVAQANLATGVDADFIQSVIKAESGANPKAVSPKGARGLMQLMPATATKLGVKDSFDPGQNIHGGAQYLRDLLVKYNGDAVKALAAYNAGPQRVAQYHGIPPYRETQLYVARIIRDYNRRKAAEKIASAPKKKQQLAAVKAAAGTGE